jgi:transcription initiation factor TFIIE subunit alpha
VRDILADSLSKDHVRIIDKLDKPQYDEDIAAELRVKATIVRTLLNELHAASLVEYDRFKNKKTGWYTYLWKRREDKINEYVRNHLQDKLGQLHKRLEDEKQSVQFGCKCSCRPFEEAVDMQFKCPSCGESLDEYDNSETIDEIVTEIAEINSLLEQT